MDSGTLRELADGMSDRGVGATFYVTPNVAVGRPDELEYLERSGHEIGVHLHPHNLLGSAKYPYYIGVEDRLTHYDFKSKILMMRIAKDSVESVLGHEVVLFRSGCLACDCQVEIAANVVGFKGISNHGGIFPIRPFKLWNLGTGRRDFFSTN